MPPGAPPSSAPSALPATVPERPALAPNVQLCGALESGFQDQQWLVLRDGIFMQLPVLLYVAKLDIATRTEAALRFMFSRSNPQAENIRRGR